MDDTKKPKKQKKTRTRRPSHIRVKWKLFGYLAVFSAVIIALLWLCQVVFLDDIYKFIKTAEVKNAAARLTEGVGSDNLDEIAEGIAVRNEVCVRVFAMDGQNRAFEILSLDTLPDCVSHNMSDASVFKLYDSAVKNDGKYLQRFRYDKASKRYYSVGTGFEPGDDEESIVYSILTKSPDGIDTLIIINSIISPVKSTVKTLNILLTFISVLLILIALLLALILSRRISKPISDINEAAKKLSIGEYDPAFCAGGYKEITELSDTLSYAAVELSKVETTRRELIANISHDLRTPLTLITGYSEVMRDIPGENTPENAQVIIDESNRLTSLVNDILEVSKFEAGNQKPEFAEIGLTETVRSAIERYNKLVGPKGYTVTFEAGEDCRAVTDEKRYLQALYNLINNAVTYTGDDMTVRVRQELLTDPATGRKRVRMTVTDSGEGIEPEKLPLIWERYYKIDKNHRRAAVGSGLGLSIVRNIMEMLGGTCGVISNVGQGSTFMIEIDAL